VLTEVSIVEGGGASVTSIPAGAGECAAGTTGGGSCFTTTDTTCFLTSAANWCRCVANPAPAAPATPPPSCTDAGAANGGAGGAADAGAAGSGGAGGSAASATDAGDAAPAVPDGTWNCDPFSPTATALFVFDRLLDTEPFDADGGAATTATLETAPTSTVSAAVDYASNGSPNEVIFPLLGTLRVDGPSLLISGDPALLAPAEIRIALNPQAVRAKDHTTPFTDVDPKTGLHNFASGSLRFSTAAFGVTITPPAAPPLPADAGACATPNLPAPDSTPATVTFTNLVDQMAVDMAITASAMVGATTADVPVDVASMDGLTFTVTPKMGTTWPANAMVTITVPGTITDLAGDTFGPTQTATFTTGAM
jgi:hypothetical protein